MTVSVRYIGTSRPYFETGVTGKQTSWYPGQAAAVSDADAGLLLATGVFEYGETAGGKSANDNRTIPSYAAAVVGAAALSQEYLPSDLPWLAARSPGAYTTIPMPSPYSPAHMLHPSIAYFPNGWRGYNYWCSYTPYPNNDRLYENPCVAASKDGNTWVAMGAQPLVANPGGSTYNSDTDLCYDAANDRLVLIYRDHGIPTSGNSRIMLMVSSDGVTWTTPVAIYTSTGFATASATDIAAPSIWYNDATAKWEIVGHNLKDSASAWPLVKITSSSLLSGWDTSLTTLTFTPPSGRKWWHSQFRRLSSGAIVGMAQDNDGTLGSSGNVYSAYSADGSTFSASPIDLSGVWYRPSFVVKYDVVNAAWYADFFGSKLTKAGLYRAKMPLTKGAELYGYPSNRLALLAGAAISQRNVSVIDTFTRADDATTLGTSTSGATYTAVAGPTNVLGISGNKCYNVTTGNCRSTIDVGQADYIVSAKIDTKSAEEWLMVRYVDATNYLRVGVSSSVGQLKFHRLTGGSVIVDTLLGVTPANGDELTVRCVGGQITIWLNDVLVTTVTETQGLTATLVGLQMSGTLGGRLDNFIALKL